MRVGVDVGGTFTDFVLVDGSGRLFYHKVPSTPDDPGRAIMAGLEEGVRLSGFRDTVETLVHGSTVATNAVLERKGARTALVATRGFGDAFFVGRQVRPALYDLDLPLPVPLVDSDCVFEVDERVGPDGTVQVALDPSEVERLCRAMEGRGVRSVAVTLLFSYLAPGHEDAVASALREAGFSVSASSRVLPEYREYERTSTTVVNAYVAPVMDAYIGRLEAVLGVGHFGIMQSNGGCMAPGEARRVPVHTILSGPAGGVAGASLVGRLAGCERFVTFDMGGTSTDVALHDGGVAVTSDGRIEGFPLRVPMLDIHTVGAGGGSLARLDAGGALVVGPESAGAVPGPACYGRGTQAAVTDANAVLGRLSAPHFLGGRMELHVERARDAVRDLADPMGVSLEEAAFGILRVVNSEMERAIRVISVERGHDVREFALLCFGGAGGLHAVDLARALEMRTVIVPTSPGTLSACGVLSADVIKDLSRTVLGAGNRRDVVTRVLADLEREGVDILRGEGYPPADVSVTCAVDVRYAGQSYEIQVPWDDGVLETFHACHLRRFGHSDPAAPVEMVTARVRLTVATPPVVLPLLEEASASDASEAVVAHQQAWFGSWGEVPVVERGLLRAGHRLEGPAVVAEFTSTTVIPPGASLVVDRHGNLVVEVGGEAP